MGEGKAAHSPSAEDTEPHEEQTQLKKLIIPNIQPTQSWIFLKPHSIIELSEVPGGAMCSRILISRSYLGITLLASGSILVTLNVPSTHQHSGK